ncbi:MAG: ribonuclease D [Rhizobiales bacterium]|nr:ribonuclease D [Hyphomicrobiales bacterium]
MITTTPALKALCTELAKDRFIAVDTEFMREQTYWPELCLVQLAGSKHEAIVDPLAPDIDLEPFFALMANASLLKVFHAARQDIEIVFHRSGIIPYPLFDTQIAAMVCGFGDQVSYEQIVRKLVKAQIDKSSRFTDWARRPLSDKQLAYALSDVTHLRTVYEKLKLALDSSGREPWLEEEMTILSSPDTYILNPEDAWRRIKLRLRSRKQLAVLMSIAAWREREAQSRNVPRSRVIKDDALVEIATQLPSTHEALAELRALPKGYAKSRIGDAILTAVKAGLETDHKTLAQPDGRPDELTETAQAAAEILKLALKIVSEREGIAPKLIASAADIEAIAANDSAPVPLMSGWRRGLFGNLALELKSGRAVIGFKRGRAEILRHAGAPGLEAAE